MMALLLLAGLVLLKEFLEEFLVILSLGLKLSKCLMGFLLLVRTFLIL